MMIGTIRPSVLVGVAVCGGLAVFEALLAELSPFPVAPVFSAGLGVPNRNILKKFKGALPGVALP